MYRNYIGCKSAVSATAKIEFENEKNSWIVYFGDFEDANNYLNDLVKSDCPNFSYRWHEKEIDWEKGPKKKWCLFEVGSKASILAFAKCLGL